MSERQTRQPTGKPGWPLTLSAGVEKSGKTYMCADASGSDLIGRTFWISYGEIDADEYGALEGARFEIVPHNGTYRDLLDAITWAAHQPRLTEGEYAGKPNLIVLDSDTRVWAMLTAQAQAAANARRARKGQSASEDEADITVDLWNIAKDRWAHIHDALRENQGPVIVTARLELVVVMDSQGRPTREKVWKVQAEKNLPFDSDVIIQMRRSGGGENFLTGVKSLRFKPSPNDYVQLPDFVSMDALWRQLGLAEMDGVGENVHNPVVVETYAEEDEATARAAAEARAWAAQITERRDAILADMKALVEQELGDNPAASAVNQRLGQINLDWQRTHEGEGIRNATDIEGLEKVKEALWQQIVEGKPATAEPEPAGATS